MNKTPSSALILQACLKKKKKLQFSSKIIVFYVSIRGTENSDA